MRKYLAMTIVGVGLISAAAPAFAKTETVTGQIIDLYCYSRNKADTGMDHREGRECAWSCIRYEGQPVGLLTSDGKVYQVMGPLVAGNNIKVAPHLTHTVTITGEVTEDKGLMIITASDLTMVKK